jgi:predicted dinucleotide-binding enzyme
MGAADLGRPVLKVFNNIFAANLENKGEPVGTPGRIALTVAGDDAAAKQKAMALVEELGFDAIDGGSLHESWRQQPGSPLYCTDLSADEVRKQLASLGTQRTPEQHAEFAANQANSEKQLEAQGVKL